MAASVCTWSGVRSTAELATAGFDDAREIGRGGFGAVYRCRQRSLERTVAIKVLTTDLEPDNVERFLREQRAMGRLTGHPNISLVIPGGSHGDIATASVVVNSIPVILDAPAGLRTARDLPIGFFSPNAKP